MFIAGFYIGRLTKLVIPITGGYPVVYTINSRIDSYDGYTGEQLEIILQNTPLKGTGKYFSYFAWKNNISSLYLIAHAFHESARGTNLIAPYNIFGYGANDRDPKYYAWAFDSFKDCIAIVSYYIKTDYLTPGGSYYVSSTLAGMNVHYAKDQTWKYGIVNIMNELHYKIGDPKSGEIWNWYYQNFSNYPSGTLTKGQVVRDLAKIYSIQGTAGTWAESIGLFSGGKWWDQIMTREELIKCFKDTFKWKYPIDIYTLQLQVLAKQETYEKYYLIALKKYYQCIGGF